MPAPSEPVTPEPTSVAPGTVIAQRYRVDAVLGEGGMGIVYLAEHVHMRKRVALKVLLPQWTSAPEVVARFEREAVAAGAITHPNVATATDFGRLADGSFFLVLEYVDGRTLRSELGAGPIAPRRALGIARGVALGVGAAHAKGIVHRDLKPENVMLVARDGDPDFVKVLDFGIARVVEGAATAGQALTSAGAILGTPDYMAPEQIVGGEVDARADLYALGVMLFEMLTGGCPFRGGSATLLRQHLLNEPPPLPADAGLGVPESVRGLVARLMQKEAGARFANATELLAALDAAREELAPSGDVGRAPTQRLPAVAEPASLRGWAASSVRVAMGEPRARTGALVLAVAAVIGVTALVLPTRSGGVPETKPRAETAAAAVAAPAPPDAPAESARVEKAASHGRPATPLPPPSAMPRKRKTGPGGIYVPPPSQWFR